MSRQAKSTVSDETKTEAMNITRATQKPGQTKEQSKLIAQGIQKGIDLYKKQQKAKARDLDRQKKKIKPVNARSTDNTRPEESGLKDAQTRSAASKPRSQLKILVPWLLLLVSWLIFAAYFWY
ncbi:DUF2956 domain-containing protein [Neptunomonas qingdaonensis]|uniref:DUF2956 domain-containing protein n=1 Tax=Neptunomonas qingdaonensis TaxID=1045558 RepID=A0A1I2UYL8_9GAMM|nr:DUF2956 domain-containing protein [Neptunomonas qingdaonensis]SFG80076.1 Protein of unknown function [Neptunomonas qingdaonensis]